MQNLVQNLENWVKRFCFSAWLPLVAVLFFVQPVYASESANKKSEHLDLSSLSLAGIYVMPVEKRVKALNFQLEDLKTGQEVTLSDYRDKVLAINFWATWCPPCRAEMPAIEVLHRELKDSGLVWLAIDSGEDRAIVDNYIKKYKYTFPVLLDPENAGVFKYGVQSLPATIIVNKHGYIVALAFGSVDWRNHDVVAVFRKLLAE
ncbi:TlpA disulfide reductase family protein [Candidatus Haliotispira prima]|uniref:TlpA disulfide reductase family protein n=1 Tax=Candidatus Haliotispira prima TaxID=3034016 RepID=A0ABY8MET6_9SPIO|nr:TlpA disulfide reductase family protein [Candidatus Haliotispira prima]